jgi:hypothetical protein
MDSFVPYIPQRYENGMCFSNFRDEITSRAENTISVSFSLTEPPFLLKMGLFFTFIQ